ncbi:2-oxo acid dehydrogenase subunit E2 [Asanoa sp. NPDC049573]|uniref:2-oxo acid dehydrogenase subunit E2 n=1 Tax=Asanoa sp. NPDC049573 TaxID=3155396 RepID=UPI00342700FA
MHDIFVPALGHAMEDCVVVEWLKQPGDQVVSGEDVVEIETDKSAVEVASEYAGTLGRHRYQAGDRVPVGKVLAYVLAPGETEPDDVDPAAVVPPAALEAGPTPEPTASGAGPTPQPPASGVGSTPVTTAADGSTPAPTAVSADGYRHRMSPRQRRLAREAAETATADRGRAATAAAVTKSWQSIPQFSVARDIRGEAVLDAVRAAREAGTAATVTDVLLVAFARALTAVGVDTDPSIGVAVATTNGVAIPVVPRPDSSTLDIVTGLRAAAAERARGGRSIGDDAIPVTATVSNLGAGGVRSFTGVVPLGQTLLLTVGSIRSAAIVEDGRVIASKIMTVTLNVDHRAYDGTHAAAILEALARELESAPAHSVGKGDQSGA